MAYVIAGTRGGLQFGLRRRWNWLPVLVRGLVDGHVRLRHLTKTLVRRAAPCHVGIVVNMRCNLACRHCYLQTPRLYGEVLRPEEWKQVFRDVVAAPGVRLVSLVGKEVFVDGTGVELLRSLVEAGRLQANPPRFGVVTNGTRLGAALPYLRELGLDYLDVSIDGIGAVHDAIRGRGTFEQVVRWLPDAVETLGADRLYAVTTVQRLNFRQVPETIAELARLGLRRFGLQFYIPTPVTPRDLALSPWEVAEFFMGVMPRLADMPLPDGVRVHLDVDAVFHAETIAFLQRAGYLNLRRLRVDTEGHLYHKFRLGAAECLVEVAPIPVGFWRTVRLTAEGLYLGAEDSVDTTRYAERAIGDVRTTPFRELFRRGLESERFRQLLREYYETRLPILQEAVRSSEVGHETVVAVGRPRAFSPFLSGLSARGSLRAFADYWPRG
jgi:hypothetical protein